MENNSRDARRGPYAPFPVVLYGLVLEIRADFLFLGGVRLAPPHAHKGTESLKTGVTPLVGCLDREKLPGAGVPVRDHFRKRFPQGAEGPAISLA